MGVNQEDLANIYIVIGDIYSKDKNFKKSIKFYNRALNLYRESLMETIQILIYIYQ